MIHQYSSQDFKSHPILGKLFINVIYHTNTLKKKVYTNIEIGT